MFPSRRASLPRTPHSRLLRRLRIRSSKGRRALSSPYRPIGALPRRPPQPRLSCETLRGELAITGLDWFLAPSPRSTHRIARQDAFGPRPSFRPASPCPGLDRPVSSLTAVTTGPVQTRPLAGASRLRASRFPCAYPLDAVKLATTVNSPARVSRRSGRRRMIRPPRLFGVFGRSTFGAVLVRYQPVSTAFHPPPGVVFNFPSRYCCAIGLGRYLGLEASGSFLPAPYPRYGTRVPAHLHSQLPLRGFHPLRRTFPGRFGSLGAGGRLAHTPHPHVVSHEGLVWPHPLSLAVTRGVSFDFFSSAYLDASVRPVPTPQIESVERRPTPKRWTPRDPIRESPDQRLHAATRGLSQLATPFVGPQAELSTGWRSLA